MTAKRIVLGLLGSTALTAAGALASQANAAPCSSPYVVGDVFASVGSSSVDVFTPTGTLVCTLNDASGASFTTGSAFDASGNFYVTNFDSDTVSQFNNSGTLLHSSYMSSGNTPESIFVSGTGPFAGTSFVGGERNSATINQFNTSTGALVHSFTVAGGIGTNGTGTLGTDWVDLLSPTSNTILYDGEGTEIKSFNLATNTQNPDFTSAATEGALTHIFAFRVIPSGTFAGDVLVSNSINAVLLDANGNIIKTYTLPGDSGGDFSLNLDPNGTDFWTGDDISTNVWEVNIATGAIDEQFTTGTGVNTFFGLSVFGEATTGTAPPPTTGVPEPASLALIGTGLLGLGAVRRWKKSA